MIHQLSELSESSYSRWECAFAQITETFRDHPTLRIAIAGGLCSSMAAIGTITRVVRELQSLQEIAPSGSRSLEPINAVISNL